jgi:regulator of RNase E activity RraA
MRMIKPWKDDDELFSLARRTLMTALVGDAMDKLGLVHQFLPPYLKPLDDSMVIVGRALTVVEEDVSGEDPGRPLFGIMFEALDDLKSNEVYVCSGASPRYALWGEMMSTRARKLGAAGAVVDGYSRDTLGILRLNLPTFSRGRYAQDQGPRGQVVDFRVPLQFGDVLIQPGDIIFGDLDGVCVVPQEAEEDVFTHALEKASREKTLQKALESGMSTVEAFKMFGIM